MKSLIESVRAMYGQRTEATMMQDDGKMVHNCAKHVEHAEYGKGNCIAEEHADPDRYGNIAWYDIEFPHGVERGVPISELKVLQAESHGHATKKAKKMAEAAPGGSNAGTDVDSKQAIKKKAMSAAAAAADKNSTEPLPAQGMKEETEQVDEKFGGTQNMLNQTTHKNNDPMRRLKITTDHPRFANKPLNAHSQGILKKRLKNDQGTHVKPNLPEEVEVDETIIHKDMEYTIAEADKNYEKYFKAKLKSSGKSIGGMSDDEKKKFFNDVDRGFKAKNEETFVEAFMHSDLEDVKNAHKKAGNKISDEKSGNREGKPHHSFVVTTPEGKRTRHIYHGSTKKLETMSPAKKSKQSQEQDLDDKD